MSIRSPGQPLNATTPSEVRARQFAATGLKLTVDEWRAQRKEQRRQAELAGSTSNGSSGSVWQRAAKDVSKQQRTVRIWAQEAHVTVQQVQQRGRTAGGERLTSQEWAEQRRAAREKPEQEQRQEHQRRHAATGGATDAPEADAAPKEEASDDWSMAEWLESLPIDLGSMLGQALAPPPGESALSFLQSVAPQEVERRLARAGLSGLASPVLAGLQTLMAQLVATAPGTPAAQQRPRWSSPVFFSEESMKERLAMAEQAMAAMATSTEVSGQLSSPQGRANGTATAAAQDNSLAAFERAATEAAAAAEAQTLVSGIVQWAASKVAAEAEAADEPLPAVAAVERRWSSPLFFSEDAMKERLAMAAGAAMAESMVAEAMQASARWAKDDRGIEEGEEEGEEEGGDECEIVGKLQLGATLKVRVPPEVRPSHEQRCSQSPYRAHSCRTTPPRTYTACLRGSCSRLRAACSSARGIARRRSRRPTSRSSGRPSRARATRRTPSVPKTSAAGSSWSGATLHSGSRAPRASCSPMASVRPRRRRSGWCHESVTSCAASSCGKRPRLVARVPMMGRPPSLSASRAYTSRIELAVPPVCRLGPTH